MVLKRKVFILFILLLVFLTSCDFNENDELNAETRFNDAQSIFDSLFGEVIIEDIILPNNLGHVYLTWTSNREEYLTNTGIVSRGSEDVRVELTVEMKYKTFTRKIIYELTIKAKEVLVVGHNVIFNSKGGKNVVGYREISNNSKIIKPIDPTRPGFIFKGWFKEEESINEWDFDNDFVIKDLTLYAKWEIDEQVPTYERVDNYIYFGEYPQTIKEESVVVSNEQDSRGYFLGSDGAYYAKVVASPYDYEYKFSDGNTLTYGTTYYFKVEPIKWRILTENNEEALILCESIIANIRYDASSSNYMDSEIRAWLNNEFYNTAFNELQLQFILTTEVDNSAESTEFNPNPYVCENTFDKIFLLSYQEVTNSNYGFESGYNLYDPARQRQTTDYSRATGAYTNTSYYLGMGIWWLRSPFYDSSMYARFVIDDGYVYNNYVSLTTSGVVPALKIKLS